MTDPRDMNDLITVEKANASLVLIRERIVPSPRGARPAARPTAAERYPGNDVTPAVGPTALAEHIAGDDCEGLSIDTA